MAAMGSMQVRRLMNPLLTRRAAAEQLSISLSSLDRLRDLGELETIPVGGRKQVPQESIDAYLDRQRNRERRLRGIDEAPRESAIEDLAPWQKAKAGDGVPDDSEESQATEEDDEPDLSADPESGEERNDG